nr:YbfB/YjiJ family MFS transporter [Mycobacterium tuberculosis]
MAAVGQGAPQWLGGSTWLVVGMASVPSAALWAALSTRWSNPALLTAALVVQAVGIAASGAAGGVTAALGGAVLFGGTFVGLSTLALAGGRRRPLPRGLEPGVHAERTRRGNHQGGLPDPRAAGRGAHTASRVPPGPGDRGGRGVSGRAGGGGGAGRRREARPRHCPNRNRRRHG